ncbi:MAG: hypothetical protein M3P97_03085 [Actinomycetota bacterium]|nr:hypothetical protein [Actinomycetota bacterium]
MFNVGALELLIVLVLLLVPLGISLWGILDAAARSDGAWQQAGQSKILWIALQVVGIFLFVVVGLAVSVFYLVAIRPKVSAAELG